MSKIKGITITLGADVQPLNKALEGVNKKSRDLQSELRQVDRLLKLDPKNTELLKQKQDLLTQAVGNTKDKLDTLKEAEKQAQQQFKNGEIGEEQYRAIQREVASAEQNLKSLEKQLKEVNSGWKNAAEGLDKFGKKSKEVGKSLSTKVTAPVVALGGLATKSAMDFESAFAGVVKTVDATDEELANLRTSIREMSKEIPASTTAISAVAEAAGQLGIEVPNIMDFTRAMIDLGESSNLSAEEAASSLAQFANITRMSQKDFDRLGSVIVGLGNNLATTEADIVSMGMRLAGAGKQIGLTEAEIMSFAGALSSVGIEADAGGSAFSKVMIEMQLAVETGSKGLKDFANVAGMTTDEFSKAFKEDAGGAIIEFIEGLGKTEEKGMSAIKVLDDMGIKEVRLRDALLRASGASDVFTDAIGLGSEAWKENTALTDEASQRYETSESKMAMFKNTLNDLGITFGEVILPVVIDFIEGLKGVLDWLGGLSPATQKVIIVIAAIVAAIGPLLFLVGSLATGLSSIITIAPVVGAAMAGMLGPILIIIGIVAALIAIGVLLYKNWDTIKEKAGQLKDWLGEKWTEIKDNTTETFNNIKNAILTPIHAAREGIRLAIDKIKGFFNFEWKFPKIKLPHFSVSWTKDGFWGKVGDIIGLPGRPKLAVDWYKDGAIFTQPTLFNTRAGVKGVGEAGAEAVLPISRLDGIMASALNKAGVGGMSGAVIHNYMVVDGEVMAKSIHKVSQSNIRRYELQGG